MSDKPIWSEVPHKRVTIGGMTFDAPVAIVFRENGSPCRPYLQEDGNGYIYALPNGGRIDSLGQVLNG
jgi:hypothetical protein